MSSLVLILLLAAAATACVSALIFALQRPGRSPSGPRPARSKKQNSRQASSATPAAGAAATTHQLSAAERDEMLDGVKNLAENDPEKVAGLIRSWISEDDPPRS